VAIKVPFLREGVYFYWAHQLWCLEGFGGMGRKKPLQVVRISFWASPTADNVMVFADVLRRFFLISNVTLSISQSTSSLPSSSFEPAVYLQPLTRKYSLSSFLIALIFVAPRSNQVLNLRTLPIINPHRNWHIIRLRIHDREHCIRLHDVAKLVSSYGAFRTYY
jgi:hypothetical protein